MNHLLASAFLSLRTNKLRTVLTALGVVMGVASVVLMVSIVEGARRKVIGEFENIGANLIFVVYQPEQRPLRQRGFSPFADFQGLTLDDARHIERTCDQVVDLSPEMRLPLLVRSASAERTFPVMGVTEQARRVFTINVVQGRGLTRLDVEAWARVAVLGQEVADELFPGLDPVGKEVSIRGLRLRVIGVLEKKGRALGENRDNTVYIPLTVMHRCFLGREIVASIVAKAARPETTAEAADQIWAALARRHHNLKDFVVDTQDNLLTSIGRILNLFLYVLGGIGGLSLLTGGIGIMNIMLVSVTERTREIGIRRAVGAKASAIFAQFLLEAVALSGTGGLVGLGMGFGLARLVNQVMGDRLPTFTPLWAGALAFVCASSVGIFFGSYPASRAAKLDPIEALRWE